MSYVQSKGDPDLCFPNKSAMPKSRGVCAFIKWNHQHFAALFSKKVRRTNSECRWYFKKCKFFRATVLHCAVVQVSGSFSQSSSGVLIKRCNEVWTVFQGAVARIQQQPSGHRWREEGVCLIEKNPFVFVLSFHFVLINQRLAGTPLLIYHHPQSDQPYRQPWQPERP